MIPDGNAQGWAAVAGNDRMRLQLAATGVRAEELRAGKAFCFGFVLQHVVVSSLRTLTWRSEPSPDAASSRGAGGHVARDVGKGVVCTGGDGRVYGFADGVVDVVPGRV